MNTPGLYYTGIIYERRAKVALRTHGLNAYELFRQAMDWFEKAEAFRIQGNDEAILRWNCCARIIIANKLVPRDPEDEFSGINDILDL